MSLIKSHSAIPATLLCAALSMAAWAGDAPTASPPAQPETPEV
jgi:hypothetical protein